MQTELHHQLAKRVLVLFLRMYNFLPPYPCKSVHAFCTSVDCSMMHGIACMRPQVLHGICPGRMPTRLGALRNRIVQR